jgi:acetyl esterase/lipase
VRVVRGQLKLLGRLWALHPPLRLVWRVHRWFAGYLVREFAWWYAAWCVAGVAALVALGWASAAAGTVAVAALGLAAAWFAWLGVQSVRSARAVDRALEAIPGEPAELRFPRSHLILPPLMLVARSVRRQRGIVFHSEGRLRLRLDVYRPASEAAEGPLPAVVQVHGGGWISGSRLEQGIPLLNHLASNGWIGFNVDYRLSPRATLPDHVIDVKRAIAWVRANAEELGVDPERVAITGGSAGGHLTALAALTSDDRALQPGFEDADTSVAAAVPFYGVYDMLDSDTVYYEGLRSWLLEQVVIKRRRDDDPEAFRAVSPTHRVHPGAPPFLIFHGEHDSLVPVDDARTFARRLTEVSRNEVLYVELPGAEHAFDLFPSARTAHVVEGIERFLRAQVPAGGERSHATGDGSSANPIAVD